MKHIIFIIFIVLASCHSGFKSEKEFLSWLGKPENGLLRTKTIGDIQINVKHLPSEYVAYREFNRMNKNDSGIKDSLLRDAANSLVFLLTVKTAGEAEKNDVLTHGAFSLDEYNTRATALNFNMQQYITLKTKNGIYKPVLATMENSYGLSNYRTIYIVFSPKESGDEFQKSESFDFIFQDDIFNTGINHFIFNKKDIDGIKPLQFWK